MTAAGSASLLGKVAIVTGAAAGIGLATAKLFAREGAIVILADVADKAGREACDELVAGGWTALYQRTDVTREDDVRAVIERAVGSFGKLDILFNNAGVVDEKASTTRLAKEEWDAVIATNLTGTFLAMKYGIAAMVDHGGGSVVNNASVLGLVGLANHPAYSASKGGVIALTKNAAMEFAKKGVRVNCLCPGFVDTDMVMGTSAADAARRAMLEVMTPLGRLGLPEEIAEMVLFLASDRSSFMTGAVVPVDGGYVAR